jgi:hypothetical protein
LRRNLFDVIALDSSVARRIFGLPPDVPELEPTASKIKV